MISDNKTLTDLLCLEISSRFLLSTFPKRKDGIMTISKERMNLFLGCYNPELVKFLKENDYHNLIADILMYTELTPSFLDLLSTKYTSDEIQKLKTFIDEAQKSMSYIWCEDGLMFDVQEFYIDIIIDIISQFHLQIISVYADFKKTLKAIPDVNFFLEATTPSYSSQYAQYWVAEKLDMLKFYQRIAVG